MKWQIQFLETEDKQKIRVGTFSLHPEKNNFKRAIVFSNGRTEWIEKYDFLPMLLPIRDDVLYVSWDHRGQGNSTGQRSYIETYDLYVKDMKYVIESVVGELPYLMMCHSMGGLIALLGLMNEKIHPEKLVLSSPLLRIPNDPIPRVIAKPFTEKLHQWGLGKIYSGAGSHEKVDFKKNKLTHDIVRYQFIQSSPFRVPSASFGWVDATYKAIDQVFSENKIKKLKTPLLIMTGTEERVVDMQGTTDWVQKAEGLDIPLTYEIIEEARHELFSEIDRYRGQAIQFILDFAPDYFKK